MNKSFRSIWNASKQAYVAAAETVSAKGKPSSGTKVAAVVATLLGGLLGLSAHAQTAPPPNTLPTGGQVSAGAASISSIVSSSGANMVIQQSSDRAAINWQSFNVGKDAQVQFNQPNAASVTLNRVMSADPSQIFGRITANGQVILSNPAGVYFGKDARVDVGGLVATTHGISDADFMAGNNRFERNGSAGSVVNEGELKAALGGYIALLAPDVRNQGAIIAHMGTVALAAGDVVDLRFDSNNRLTSLRVEPSQIQALVDNQQAVQAPGGLIILAAQAMDRLVGGVVKTSGTLQASSLTEKGGRIVLEADHITLAAGSVTEATGATGGGTVLVGGDWQGSGDMHQATTVTMEAGASIDVSATQQGDGGKVVLWSDVHQADSLTTAQGSVLAKGGAQGGNGGQVETSGHNVNIDNFKVDTRSASDTLGKTGLWLIDPYTYNIYSAQAATIGSALNSSDVTITTSVDNSSYGSDGNSNSTGDITLWNGITKTAPGTTTLTLRADRIVAVASPITSTGGPLNVVLWSDYGNNNGGGSAIQSDITTNGGHLWVGGSSTAYGSTTWNGLTVGNGPSVGGVGTNWFGLDIFGHITTNGGSVLLWAGPSYHNSAMYGIGLTGDKTISAGTGNVIVLANQIYNANSSNGTLTVNTTGQFTLAPADGAWTSGLNWTGSTSGNTFTLNNIAGNGQPLTIQNMYSLGGLNLGYYNGMSGLTQGNTSNITVSSAISIGGPVAVYGGNITVTQNVTSTGNGIKLQGNLITLNSGTTLSALDTNNGRIEINGAVIGPGNMTAAKSVTVNLGTTGANYEGVISGTATLIKSGSPQLMLLGTSTYTGGTNLNSGELVARSNSALGTGTLTMASGTTLVLDYLATEVANAISLSGNANISLYNNTVRKLSGNITGTGGLTLDAFTSGTIKLTGTNSYAGTTTLSRGNIYLGDNTSTGSFGAGAVSVTGIYTPHLFLSRSNDFTLANNISGAVTLEKLQANTATLTGTNNYSGTTTISAGTLQLGNGGTTGTLGTGIVIDNSALTFNRSDNLSVTNTISGTGSLTQAGSGTLTLTQNNTYAGTNTISNGVLVLANNAPNPSSKTFSGTGQLRIEPSGTGFTSAFNTSGWTFGNTLTGLTLGSSTNTQEVTFDTALTVAGPITVYSDTVNFNAPVTATNSTMTLVAKNDTGSQIHVGTSGGTTGKVTADKLLVKNFQLADLTNTNSTPNPFATTAYTSINTLAADNVYHLYLTNDKALTVGTVDSTHGVTARERVYISTVNGGNLTVADNIHSGDTSSWAINLRADALVAAGTATGGNVIIDLTNHPTITTGTGGKASLYTGSLAGSTGVAESAANAGDGLLAYGSGRFRYNSKYDVSNFSATLGSGLYAIYREQPTVSVSINNQSITYGDALPTLTGTLTGAIHGDTGATYGVSNRLNSTSGNIKAGSYTLTETGLASLGYSVTTVAPGTLTVAQKALTVSGLSSANKIYDGTLSATVNGTAALQASEAAGTGSTSDGKAYTGDTVSLTGTAVGTFNTKDVATANTVAFTGLSLTGADAGNYTLTPHASVSNTITAKALTISGLTSANKIYDGTLAATVNGTAALQASEAAGTGSTSDGKAYTGDTVSLTGTAVGTFNDKDVADATTVAFTGLSLTGANAGNYTLTPHASVSNTITPKALTISGLTSANKTYDGTLAATVNSTAALQASEAAGTGSTSDGKAYTGDTVSLTGTAVGTFNTKDVATANTVTFTGLSLTGDQAGNYTLTPHASDTAPRITRATLTATANDDAKFLSQADPSFTASVTGFVNGETTSTATGYAAPSVSRSGSNTVAGTYANVLSASGGSADNYSVNYVAGDFTIVPSNQLLVRLANASSTYGSATQYTLSSVEYYNGSTVVRLDNSSVANSSASINVSNQVAVADGVGGTASFTLAPQSAVTSTAGKLAVGSYQLGTSGLVSENSVNFSDTVTVVGAHQVNTKGVTASASNVSKVYDGTIGVNGVSMGLSTLESGDVVSVSGQGAFASKNVGSGLSYTMANLALSGTDAANYYLTGGTSFTGNNGAITPKTLLVNYTGVDKVYDGDTSATVTSSDNRIVGDVLTLTRSANFADKNVGSGKTVSVTGVSLSGADAGNYTVASTGTASATITRLSSVTWIGGTTGNWFDPANWAGGAVPDLSNVANVVIPQGVVVSFDTAGAVSPADASQAVNIDGLGASGSLTQTNGTLNVGTGGITLDTLTQNGGTLTNAGATTLTSYSQNGGNYSGTGNFTTGNFTQTGGTTALGGNLTVTQGFSQGSNGSVTVNGNANITDTSGGMTLGNLDVAGNLNATSTGGDITQANGSTIVVDGITTLNAGSSDITLNGANNDFAGTVNATGNDVTLRDVNALTLGTVNASGNLTLNSTGALDLGTSTVGGNLSANSGNGNITQTGALTVNGTTGLTAGTGSITLDNAANDFTSTVSVSGADITLVDDTGGLTLGNVDASGNLTATSTGGDITQANGTTIAVDGTTTLNAGNCDITLNGANNDFGGTVNATGNNVALTDANALTLGTVTTTGNLTLASTGALNLGTSTVGGNLSANSHGGAINLGTSSVGGNLNVNSGNGNITQTGALSVDGTSHLDAGTGRVTLTHAGNRLPKGVTVTAASYAVAGDARKDAAELASKAQSVRPVLAPAGTGLSNANAPQPLVLQSGATAASAATGKASGSATPGNTSSANSSGVTVDLHSVNQQDTPYMVAVSLPKGASTVGTGFSFELPESVKPWVSEAQQVQLEQANGAALPAWLRFDLQTQRFEANAVPDGAFPMQVVLQAGGQRVLVVISERTE
jgi:filamentous hemagglutinin family protein